MQKYALTLESIVRERLLFKGAKGLGNFRFKQMNQNCISNWTDTDKNPSLNDLAALQNERS